MCRCCAEARGRLCLLPPSATVSSAALPSPGKKQGKKPTREKKEKEPTWKNKGKKPTRKKKKEKKPSPARVFAGDMPLDKLLDLLENH